MNLTTLETDCGMVIHITKGFSKNILMVLSTDFSSQWIGPVRWKHRTQFDEYRQAVTILMNMLWEPEQKGIKRSFITICTCWSSWGYLFIEIVMFKMLCRKEGKRSSSLAEKCWQLQSTFPPNSNLLFSEHSVALFSKGTYIWLHQNYCFNGSGLNFMEGRSHSR